MMGRYPPFEQITDGEERHSAAKGSVLRELHGKLAPSYFGIFGGPVKPKRALHSAARYRIDADSDADLINPGSTFAQRPLAPNTHGCKSRVTYRVTGRSQHLRVTRFSL